LANAGGSPLNGSYDFKFTLFDAPTGGTQLGPQLCTDNLAVTGGNVSLQLDFGPQFTGQQRFVEIQVRQDTGLNCSDPTGFTILSPRQAVTAVPYGLYSLNAAAADASQLSGRPAAFYTNAANLTSGSIPHARLLGTYSSALNLTNSSNIFVGSGAGLTSLNASSLATAEGHP
jgi:hypothetical protein